jgi:hypothetical protein
MQPITITVRNEQYNPIVFHAPVPLPGPACSDLIPQDQRELELKNQQQMQQQRDARICAKKESAQGFLQKVDATCEIALSTLDKSVQSVINSATQALQSQNDDHAFGRLRQHFPDLVTERLVGDFRCKLCTRNGVLSGFLQVTNNHVLFIPEDGTPFAIPLCAILCIQTIKSAQCPAAIPPRFTTAPLNDAQGLQIFVTSGQLFIFKEFLSLRCLPATLVSEAFTTIDHMWRASTAVPNPNWQFVESDKFVQPDVTVCPVKSNTTCTEQCNTTHAEPSRVPTQPERRVNALETHS